MATTIGTVVFNVNLNGKTLPVQARKIGQEIGQALDKTVGKNDAFDKQNRSLKRLNGESTKFFKTWKEMPHGFKQAVFYTGLFASLGTEISGLGSAAGSSLAVAGIAATALGVGLAALIVGLQGVTGELDAIAPGAQAAVQAFRDLGAPLHDIQQSVQGALFADLADQISSLATTVLPILNAGLTATATTLNTLFAQILTGLQSTQTLSVLTTLFEGFQPIILNIGQGLIQLVEALGNIAVIGLPFAQNFASVLNDLLTQFNAFTASAEGAAAITEFFQNGQAIIGAILPLLGAVGSALNDLVTPETVVKLVETLGALTELMEPLGQILGVIGQLDPIGLAAQLLNDLFQAIQPSVPALMELATILNGVLSDAIATVAPALGQIVAALVPLATTVAIVAARLLDALLPAIQPIIDAVVELVPILQPLVNLFGDILVQAIETLVPVIVGLVAAVAPLVASLLPPLMGIVSALAPVFFQLVEAIGPLVNAILPILTPLLTGLLSVLQPVLDLFIALITPILSLISPLLELIGPILGPLIELLVQLLDAALMPVVEGLTLFLVPAVIEAVDIIKSFLPAIESVMQIFGGLIDFLVGVFTGDWDRAWGGIKDIVAGNVNLIVNLVEGMINGVIDLINGLLRQANGIASALGLGSGVGLIGHVDFPDFTFARGGFVNSPTRALIGEAGPEMVVPLNRPLSQVDPAARALSAIAQGKSTTSTTTDGRSTIVEEGAIQIITQDGELAASAALDRLVALIGG